jgi:hypothetical protein
MNIYEKLIEVRKTVPYLQKENSGNQYNYVSSSQVLANVRTKMDELGLLLIPKVTDSNVIADTVVNVDKDKSGNEKNKHTTTYFTELKMLFTWVNAEEPKETIECPWYGQGVDIAGEKGVGKAMTYAEKYFMLKFFNIATDKDDPDSFQEKHEEKPEKANSPKSTEPPATKRAETTKPSQDGNKILCDGGCGTELTPSVITFCQHNEERFKGKMLCQKCQGKYPPVKK